MKKILLSIGVLIISLATQLALAAPAQAYSDELMMDNSVFDNKTAWTEDRIRSFINVDHASGCLKTSGSIFPEPVDYFTYKDGLEGRPNNPVDAARVIWNASQYSDINPQVIIATLQKEQSLVTRTNCMESASIDSRNKAMGMGCPDNGPCPAPAFAGFSRQVMKGAWQLAYMRQRAEGNVEWGDNGNLTYYGYMTKGTHKRCSTCSPIYFDGYGIVDGQNTFMGNGATASFYTYTPHLHQALPSIFEGWFGPTTGGPAPVYRLANYITKERLLTPDASERSKINGKGGWVYEGVAFTLPPGGLTPVYRLANFLTQERLLTLSLAEVQAVGGKGGWVYEGAAFKITDGGLNPVYRMANFKTQERLLTTDILEVQAIGGKGGWVYEGAAFKI